MKILFIIDGLVKGGKERRLLELLKGLQHYPETESELVLFSRKVEYPGYFDLGIPIHYLERKPKKDPRVFTRFYALVKQFQPDIIHSWGSMPSVYAAPTVMLTGTPLVNGMIVDAPHKMGFFDERLFRARLTFPFSKLILGNSFAGLLAYGAPPKKSLCIHNGFDFRRIESLESKKEIRKRLGITTEKVVAMVGAFEDRKDYQTYIQAAIKVLDTGAEVTFLAIGDGNNRDSTESIIPEAYKQKILFTGKIQGVESVINVCDIGVLATNAEVHGEGISNAILEFMAMGKPVVATDSGGTSEIVVDKETGFLIPDKDVAQMATKIQYLLEHPDIASQMGDTGYKRVKSDFNLEKMAAKYDEIYRKVLNSG